MQLTDALAAYRRTGADLPWGDPVTPHGVAMEGWFWRVSDPATGRVIVVLCGACHGAAGPWTLVALAASPGGFMRTSICPPTTIAPSGRTLRVPDGALEATPDSLRVLLGPDARLEIDLHDQCAWPATRARPFGGLGVAHGVPGLGQYWHPHLLGARVTGRAVIGDEQWNLDGAEAYAEKNWGGGFPANWWWGQAQGFDGGERETCVAFAGGDVRLGPVGLAPTALVVRLKDEVVQLALPKAIVAATSDGRSWSLRARSPRYRVTLDGDANGDTPHHLPVPVPGAKTITNGATQHFAGRLRLRVERGRRLLFDGVSEVAALERGDGGPG
jgi:hypothetical protein